MTESSVTPKLKALVHFVIASCPAQSPLGAVRLNKTLWFSDVLAFKHNGVGISGATYIKKPHGPVARLTVACLNELVAGKAINVTEPQTFYGARAYRSLREPDVHLLREDERELVKFVLNTLLGFTATDVSEMSHDRIWDMADDGEEIPLYATLGAFKGNVTPEVIEWAKAE